MIVAMLHLVFGISSVLQPIEDAVRWLLERFHYNVGLPWAWAIVATTIVVRICLVPLTVKQIHSMQALQAHAPEMKEIQKKYKGDRQKLNEEMMKFYRENNINPAASCLPLLAQLPVFFALFFVLKDFSKQPAAGPARLARDRAEHRRAGDLALVGLPAARDLRRQPGRLDLVHVDDDAQGAALHDARAAADLHRRRGALPGGPRPLLGDDEPVDGRPGPRHAPARAAHAARRDRRREGAGARSRRRTTAATAPARSRPSRSRRRPRSRSSRSSSRARSGARRAAPASEPSGPPARSPSRRPARPSARRSGRRCASSSG